MSTTEGKLRKLRLTEHATVVELHVPPLRASLDGIEQLVGTQEARGPDHVEHFRQAHQGQPHCCHHLAGAGVLAILSAPATQCLEDLSLTRCERVSPHYCHQGRLKEREEGRETKLHVCVHSYVE